MNVTEFGDVALQFGALSLLLAIIIILLATFCLLCAVAITCPHATECMWCLVLVNVAVSEACNVLAAILLEIGLPIPACNLGDEDCCYNIMVNVFILTAVENFAVLLMYKMTVCLVTQYGIEDIEENKNKDHKHKMEEEQ